VSYNHIWSLPPSFGKLKSLQNLDVRRLGSARDNSKRKEEGDEGTGERRRGRCISKIS
jgi:hypothetical protein